MPLPVAHSLISTAVCVAYRGDLRPREDWRWITLFVFAGLFPDIDFVTLPFSGFGTHRGLSHSFFSAGIIAGTLYLMARYLKWEGGPRLLLFLLVTVALHPLCDFFTHDYLVERGGVKLFYPLSDRYFESPYPVFMGIELRYLHTILSLHTLLAIVYETFLAGSMLLLTLYLKRGSIRPLPGAMPQKGEDRTL